MKLALVGVSHHQAPVEVRERVAVDIAAAGSLSRSIGGAGCEAVVLSTCNRTEVYLAAADDSRLDSLGTGSVLALAGDEAAALEPLLYRLADESAALHLFRVAAGLDSLIPGEGEILGQVRDAYAAGSTGPFLDRLFRTALHVGRRARVETAIGESPTSVPAAAAALAQQVFETLAGRKVVLVGAGRMSELMARNLRSRGADVVAVASRTHDRAAALASRVGAKATTLDELERVIATCDVIVTSTSAPGFVLTEADVGDVLRARRGRPLLIVDLAVPRDAEPSLGAIDGCFMYDVDDLAAVVDASLAGRRHEAIRAEQIVSSEAVRFGEWRASLSIVPAITSLRAWAEDVRASELRKAENSLAHLDPADREAVDTLTAQIVNKLLHSPTVRLKEAAVAEDGVDYAETVRYLFGLGTSEEQR